MSFEAQKWVLGQDRLQLPTIPKFILSVIAGHAAKGTHYCWLRADTIADETSSSVRTVYRIIEALVRNGYLRRARRKGEDGKQRANDYWLLLDRPDAAWDSGEQPTRECEEEKQTTCVGPQSVQQPDASLSSGNASQPSDATVIREGLKVPSVSAGPTDNAVTQKESDERSESKPKGAEGCRGSGVPKRSYRPQPLKPAFEVIAGPLPFFVFKGTLQWDAWVAHKRQTTRGWDLTSDKEFGRPGWGFPSEWPPKNEDEAAEQKATSNPPIDRSQLQKRE